MKMTLPTYFHSLTKMTFFSNLCHYYNRIHQIILSYFQQTNEELVNFAAVEDKLESLPDIQHTAAHFKTLKVNESFLQLYVDTESFRLHVDWLKAAKENFSLPFVADESASSHLLHLSGLIKRSLHQINEEVPQLTAPSLPVIINSFNALTFSIEISERLQVFCICSKRILRHFHRLSRCPKH
uniref:Uncharacterized LOC108242630 n=1 Tax=Kryptolebias marmoratus TaxID=37003 RepID=A0A3Q3BM37_KRYMA